MKDPDLKEWGRLLRRRVSERGVALKTLTRERNERRRSARAVSAAETAQEVAQKVAQAVQNEAHKRMSEIVTRCLTAVFDDPYEFQIRFERKRGKTEARLVFLRDGKEFDPKEGAGIGVTDVAAFGLRVAGLLMKRPAVRRLIVADEPFKNLNGADLQERASALLKALARDLDFQFIFVTGDGDRWLREAGRVVDIR